MCSYFSDTISEMWPIQIFVLLIPVNRVKIKVGCSFSFTEDSGRLFSQFYFLYKLYSVYLHFSICTGPIHKL